MEAVKRILIISLILTASVWACKKDTPNNAQASLENTNWVLSSVRNASTNEIMNYPSTESKKINISFSVTSPNVISFSGICNVGEGTYESDPEKGKLQVNNLVTTKIGCINAEWEVYTTSSLNEAYGYTISGEVLTVYTNGDYDLYFVKQ